MISFMKYRLGLFLILPATVFFTGLGASNLSACEVGHKAKALWKGYYYQAAVEKKKQNLFCIHYVGWSRKWDECVSPRRIRQKP